MGIPASAEPGLHLFVFSFSYVPSHRLGVTAFEREMKSQKSNLPSVEKESAQIKFLAELAKQKTHPNTIKIFLEKSGR